MYPYSGKLPIVVNLNDSHTESPKSCFVYRCENESISDFES